jgi:Rod binding domain-containing protein
MDYGAIAGISGSLPPGFNLAAVKAEKPAQQVKAVAGQFEAILLGQMLNKSLGSLMGGSDTPSGSIYGYMLTDVFSQKLAQEGGLGLGKLLEQQLAPRGGAAAAGQSASASGDVEPGQPASARPAATESKL